MPALVRNNVEGREREVLERFGEPTWANPSARVVRADTEASLVQLSGVYSLGGVLNAAARGLEASGERVPPWLKLHAVSGRRARATFAMACFWTGEARLGGLEGVLSTRTGWRGRSEVVEVDYDPSLIAEAKLRAVAERMDCAQPFDAQASFRATPKDDKYQIRRSLLRFLPLSPTQASRINATGGRDLGSLLSPRQAALWARIQANPEAAWPLALSKPLSAAYAAASPVAAGLAK